jgi:hypothetical protein
MKYQWAVRALSRNNGHRDVAEFFLYPSFCPDQVMLLLIDKERRSKARMQAESRKKTARKRNRIWLASTVIFTSVVITLVSCAVAAGPGTLSGGGWADITERIKLAISPNFKILINAYEKLNDRNCSGILLMMNDGTLAPLAASRDENSFHANLNAWNDLPEDNKFLKARLDELQKTVDSGDTYIEVDLAKDRLKLKMGTQELYSFPIVSGKGRTYLSSLGRYRSFRTPKGVFEVKKKQKNPVWYKPNWAWYERGLKPPSRLSHKQRAVHGVLGEYKIRLGDGYSIHGTRSGRIRPGKRSHGCIRMNAKDLKLVYRMVDVGTRVYIY